MMERISLISPRIWATSVLATAFVLISLNSLTASAKPSNLMLTWQQDPSSTMTIQWMEPGELFPLAEGQEGYAIQPVLIPKLQNLSLDRVPEGAYKVKHFTSNQSPMPDPEDLSARLFLAWDETGLWSWTVVRDDVPWEGVEPRTLPGRDSVELHLSTGVGEPHRYQLVLSPGRDPEQPEPQTNLFDFRQGEDLDPVGTEFKSTLLDDGYQIAVHFPLSDLGLEASQDLELGFQIYINDRDPGGPWQWLAWHPARNAHGNPESLMPIRLANEPSPPYRATAEIDYRDGGAWLSITAVDDLIGSELRLMAGSVHLGPATLSDAGGVAGLDFELPSPPAQSRWGIVRAYYGDELLAAAEVPAWMAGSIAPSPMELHYREHGSSDAFESVTAELTQMQHWNEYFLHRIELTGLSADTLYRFRLGEHEKEYAFRTMPTENDRPIRFAAGGDTRHRQSWMEQVNRQAMKYDLDFIAWGGDFAYADGLHELLYRWEEWFDAIENTLITEDGRLIPIVGTIGNHEVQGGYYTRHEDYQQTNEWRMRIAPYYYQLFAFPGQPGWGVLDFGNYLSMPVLDTNHSNPIAGKQTEWLAETLAERKGRFTHIMPMYHVPAYPSVRNFEGGTSVQVREHWLHLFEEAGVQVAFENHDHVYKRTHPIRGGSVDREGITYIGDGAWGVAVRPTHPVRETWYLARAESMRHAIIVTIEGPHMHFEVIDEDGHIIDDFRISKPE
ncbi:MAG: hypothetical protein JJU20_04535 [Opitutales bacterium]|nr:hypothetical protein [Opitutales bacterium]